MASRSQNRRTRSGVVFKLTKAAHPAPRTTVGDVGAFFRVRASEPFVNERIEIPYSKAAAKKVDEDTLRLFWWDGKARSLILVEPSGVDRERGLVWGRISEPGLYGAIGLPANPALRQTMAIFAAFTAEELRARPTLIPPVCGLILCQDPTPRGGPSGLCAVCLGLQVPELHFPEVQIIRHEPDVVFKEIPPKPPLPLWPTPNHEYGNTSQGDLDGPSSPPQLQWIFQGSGLASPAVVGADGTVYTATRGNFSPSVLHAIDGTTGLLRWSLQLSIPKYATSNPVPAIGPDGTIFVNAADGALCAVEPSGRLKWRLPGNYGFPMPRRNGDVCVWVGSAIQAIMPTGTVRWARTLVGIGSRVGALRQVLSVRNDGSVIVAGEQIWALAPADGAILWQYRLGQGSLNIQAPIVVAEDGRILFNETTTGIQVLTSSGALQRSLSWISFEFAVADTGVTFLRPSGRNGLAAVDPGGSTLWTQSFAGPNPGPPVIGRNGTVYVSENSVSGAAGSHVIRALDPQTGALRWVAPSIAANSPVSAYPIALGLAGQLIITEVTNGRIVAYSS